jgi:hypothetical protein
MNDLELDLEFDPIYKAYPNCTGINSEGKAFDKDGIEIVIDPDLIESTKKTMQAEYDAQEYARNRASEYPAITDQLDEIYHNGIDSWKAVIKVTKDKYPK